MKKAKEGDIKNGVHVIVLDEGKVDIDIRQETSDTLLLTKKELIEALDEWLMEYSDPHNEIEEALDLALKDGFLICAYMSGELVGVTIVIPFGFKNFATKYHLAYIATGKNIKGRGIATNMIQKAVNLSLGNLSLHVETDNKRAIKVYEKMGFKKPYYRMMHVGTEGDE